MPQRRTLLHPRRLRHELQLSMFRAALLIALCAGLSLAQSHSVALTFDDLPLAGEGDGATAAEAAIKEVTTLIVGFGKAPIQGEPPE